MKIAVCHLFERPDCFPIVASWIHHEWWTQKPGHSARTMETRLRQAKDPDRIPLSLLALVNNVPAGTINLVENDAETRPHLSPWLAALYVQPRFRKQGVGSALVTALVKEARRLNIAAMYLGTDIPAYYARFGATVHERVKDSFVYMKLRTRP
jgi:predicted N-acetyltransferase YhbS